MLLDDLVAFFSYSRDGVEPGLEVGGAHVDPGQVRLGAHYTVRNRTDQYPPAVGSLQRQWTTAVTLKSTLSLIHIVNNG